MAEPAVAARPAVDPSSFGKVSGSEYVVAPGDTLAVVAARTNTPIRSLIDMNGLQPPYGLAPGMRLALQQRSQYVVQAEDTLPDLAARYGVSQSDLVSINNLTPPYTLKPGQSLNIPSQSESSNLPAMTASAVPPPAPTGSVTSAPLDAPPPTASKTTGSSGGSVGSTPLPSPTVIAPTATPPKPAAPLPTTTTKAAPLPPTPTAPVEEAVEAPVPAAPAKTQTATAPSKAKTPEQIEAETEAAVEAAEVAKSAGPAAGTGKGPFVWPVQGKVIGAFGSSKDGMKNDGINIAAPNGAPVVAAADGTIAYAGNELRGFGNMILIRHEGGYVTAYAHNASLLVKKGDKVKRGQTIARVGQTGAVFGPQLHFEIRKGTQPVDPLSFLGG
ncbi:peptidoglycan DD-metalloendopeptidase family protein [Dongia sp.]|uniref:peptidoglycan DD-metalloendopeptidase family protein n=1 Tax=Dongia sp. TaxID=1977262 RepID=UPI0037513DCB